MCEAEKIGVEELENIAIFGFDGKWSASETQSESFSYNFKHIQVPFDVVSKFTRTKNISYFPWVVRFPSWINQHVNKSFYAATPTKYPP